MHHAGDVALRQIVAFGDFGRPELTPNYSYLLMRGFATADYAADVRNANAPLAMVDQYVSPLKSFRAIMMDCGTKDTLFGSNNELDQSLTRLGIKHVYETYDGDHTNRIRERIERNLLPFFSKNLVAPANPTSPQAP